MRGRITSIDESGRTIVLQTDKRKAKSFYTLVNHIAAGRQELELLLHSSRTLEGIRIREEDGRSDVQLQKDWITKVTKAGMLQEAAEDWLGARIRIHYSNLELIREN